MGTTGFISMNIIWTVPPDFPLLSLGTGRIPHGSIFWQLLFSENMFSRITFYCFFSAGWLSFCFSKSCKWFGRIFRVLSAEPYYSLPFIPAFTNNRSQSNIFCISHHWIYACFPFGACWKLLIPVFWRNDHGKVSCSQSPDSFLR